ncbi:DUF411 domain-containing protein [Bradyrhizobium betae]|uniref:DUF411 domain-containing protein n=1 Tax=Bradyrhizobium betae TaxID=244734 RepID=A0A5P6P8V1_9BRAD|nr:DUF411 domain-containing protein [Bradyrhizobium betae]MCS3727277.1 hypothetical protein [Bradyrhizobium betae]QFI74817.1 DUF411 domain-containing protein [Bradyrhizobium betae]
MTKRIHPLTRRSLVKLLAIAVLAKPAAAIAEGAAITVHKDPNCGCCTGWARHMRDAGFTVRVEDAADIASVRIRLGIPAELAGCHTAEVGGYLVEGHVPAAAVRRLLSERPDAKGIAVPGMPVGSPGMESGRASQPYTVVLFGANGQTPFMRFVGQQIIGGS